MLESVIQLGKVGFDVETGTYWGEILHLCEVETFHTDSVEELRRLIQESVINKEEVSDRSDAISPEPFFESLVICLNPALYLKLNQQAGLAGISLDQYIVDILEEVVNRSPLSETA